eukprot:TRINITY_DN74821_c0_g1_i1.p1 TRINITY_DN74821_c0_g1~~TRINITY_DN74821_c0_g1_i1.p1  ORF type:complete len:290 (-),score=49.07 TRINITY_DN74821_c0_g1_i1:41-910(-)
MARKTLLILGLGGCSAPTEAVKILLEADKKNVTMQLLTTSANQTAHHARKMAFIKRSLVNDEGQSLEDHHGDLTTDACEALCEANAGCKSFTYKPKDGNIDAWCHLKPKCIDAKSPEKLFPIDSFSTFFKSYEKMTWTERALVADEGASVSDHEKLSLEKCQQKCNADSKCNSISFGADWCHLKDKCVTADAKNSTVQFAKWVKTYYKPCTSESDMWHERSLVADTGAQVAEVMLSLADCEVKCDADPVCNSFSYKRDSNTCRLHDKVVTKADASKATPTAYHTYYKPC